MYQQITLIGNLGAAPEIRHTASGVAVANFNLAVNRSWTGQDGQTQTKTTWFRVSVWNGAADAVHKYLEKGSRVFVVGEMEEARPWTDREGVARASLEVRAQTVKFLDGQRNGQIVEGGDAVIEQDTQSAQDTAIPF